MGQAKPVQDTVSEPKRLFRESALAARSARTMGSIVLATPLSMQLLTWVAVASAIVVCSFFIFGTYTRHATVAGQLIPDTGLSRVYSPQPGIVMSRLVAEGQTVAKGEALFVLSSELKSTTEGDVLAAVSGDVRAREESLSQAREKTQHLQITERRALADKIEGLASEIGAIDSQIKAQEQRLAFARESAERYQGLLHQGYVSNDMAQQKLADQLDQESRLQGLARDRISMSRQMRDAQADLSTLALRQQNQLAQIDRDMRSASEELVQSEGKRSVVVTAPQDGVVTAITAEPGQSVESARPLLSIIPKGAMLEAQLYAPSRAIGFIHPGEPVLMRFAAYPYQKFGHATGIVTVVARSALPADQIADQDPSSSFVLGAKEPTYRITVGLQAQSVMAYGAAQPLQAGMLVEADVLLDKRRLYEWALEPLYSLTGKI
jgi:membrane fusion protein